MLANKIVTGSNKLGRQRKTINCDDDTFDNCQWMPNFKGSQRGCVLKAANDDLSAMGIKKRSQVEMLDGVDISSQSFKKILNVLKGKIKAGSPFSITFMTAEISVQTVEISFRGAFCPSVRFCADGSGAQFIVEHIPADSADGKELLDKTEVRRGWRVVRVQSMKVSGKSHKEISKLILAASNDMRVDYSVVFEESNMSWYDFSAPTEVESHAKNNTSNNHTRQLSQRLLSKKRSMRGVNPQQQKLVPKKARHKSSQSTLSLADWNAASELLDPIQPKERKNSGNISDSGNRSPSLASVAEERDEMPQFDAVTGDEDEVPTNVTNVNGNADERSAAARASAPSPALKSGALKVIQEKKGGGAKQLKINVNSKEIVTSNKSSESRLTPQAAKLTQASTQAQPQLLAVKASAQAPAAQVTLPTATATATTASAVKAVPVPVEDVTVGCDLCRKSFVIKDDELRYYSREKKQTKQQQASETEQKHGDEHKQSDNESTQNGKLLLSHSSTSEVSSVMKEQTHTQTELTEAKHEDISDKSKPKAKDTHKYRGLCANCVKRECVVELSKLDAIALAPHANGHSVILCSVDANIHRHVKWLVEDEDTKEAKDEEKEADKDSKDKDSSSKDKNSKKDKDKEKDSKKKKKAKFRHDKSRYIGADFVILEINEENIEDASMEYILQLYYQELSDQKRVRLKLKKHFERTHAKIVRAFHRRQKQLLAAQRAQEEKRKALEQQKAMAQQQKNSKLDDSDPDNDDDSDSEEEEEEELVRPSTARFHRNGIGAGSRGVPLKRHKRPPPLNNAKNARHQADESDGNVVEEEPKSVQQLIEEHPAMTHIREAEKLERDGQWETAAITYERGVQMLEEYQKELKLSTRDKRTYRSEIAEYRRKFLLVQNRLMRRSTTPRYAKQEQQQQQQNNQNNANDGGDGGNNNNDGDGDDGKKKEKVNDKKDPDAEFRDRLMADIITEAPDISFRDVTGLLNVKLALYECVILPQKRPELFTGLRKPNAGLLLFGPPGNGKTMIAKCVATECQATFFSISASSITSKWVGEAERIMRTLFNLAREKEPSIIFIDEIDSMLTARGSKNEAESSRRIKTEFLVQFDGVKASADGKEARVLLIGATNLPDQLDEAVLRRFGKRILVPCPDDEARYGILRNLASKQSHQLTETDFRKIVQKTNMYSASDLTGLCRDAAMGPLRDLGSSILTQEDVEVPPIQVHHFEASLKNARASVKEESLLAYQKWDAKFGSKLTFKLSSLPVNMHAHAIDPLD